jgi:hypothetical protein
MFYIVLFSLLSVLLVVAGITVFSRNRAELEAEEPHSPNEASRRARKAKRSQSSHDRRKRH